MRGEEGGDGRGGRQVGEERRRGGVGARSGCPIWPRMSCPLISAWEAQHLVSAGSHRRLPECEQPPFAAMAEGGEGEDEIQFLRTVSTGSFSACALVSFLSINAHGRRAARQLSKSPWGVRRWRAAPRGHRAPVHRTLDVGDLNEATQRPKCLYAFLAVSCCPPPLPFWGFIGSVSFFHENAMSQNVNDAVTSSGGRVSMSYAHTHPSHPARITILVVWRRWLTLPLLSGDMHSSYPCKWYASLYFEVVGIYICRALILLLPYGTCGTGVAWTSVYQCMTLATCWAGCLPGFIHCLLMCFLLHILFYIFWYYAILIWLVKHPVLIIDKPEPCSGPPCPYVWLKKYSFSFVIAVCFQVIWRLKSVFSAL